MTNDLYITIRNAIADAADERGRAYDPDHEAHYMALQVAQALAEAGYTVTRTLLDA